MLAPRHVLARAKQLLTPSMQTACEFVLLLLKLLETALLMTYTEMIQSMLVSIILSEMSTFGQMEVQCKFFICFKISSYRPFSSFKLKPLMYVNDLHIFY